VGQKKARGNLAASLATGQTSATAGKPAVASGHRNETSVLSQPDYITFGADLQYGTHSERAQGIASCRNEGEGEADRPIAL
jgi:hypothetical protein